MCTSRVHQSSTTPGIQATAAAAEGGGGIRGWMERQKKNIVILFATLSLVITQTNVLRQKNLNEELEAEMVERLTAAAARQTSLLERVPALARAHGLPAKAEGDFKAALLKLDAQLAEGSAAEPAPATPTPATPAASTPASGGAKPKQQAVW